MWTATEATDADGWQITYSYDQVGDQTGETWLNGDDEAIYIATMTYDNDGEMTGVDNPNATETFTYGRIRQCNSCARHECETQGTNLPPAWSQNEQN
jgi:YD repeat-containing protein